MHCQSILLMRVPNVSEAAKSLSKVVGRAGVGPHPGVQVLAPGELLHRARWLWAQADLPEAELHYLICGELPGG